MNPAIKKLDKDTGGHIVTSNLSSNVFIGNQAAAFVTSKMSDGESIITGSPTVFVNGQPMARQNDKTTKSYLLIATNQDVITQ